MLNRVRVTSDENIVRNAKIELRGPDDEWVDVSHCVSGVTVDLNVGEASRAAIDVVMTDARLEAMLVDDRTLKAFASILRLQGYAVMEPSE